MLLQHDNIIPSPSIAHYEDYCQMHEAFITGYKTLYDDIALFSALPEQFINEADPIIQQFIKNLNEPPITVPDKLQLQIITRFTEQLSAFTDKAAVMFTKHQTLAEHTVHYLQKLVHLKQQSAKKNMEDVEESCLQLMPQLEDLYATLLMVQQNIDALKKELKQLKPLWTKIAKQMPH